MHLRLLKIFIALAIGFWGVIGVVGNIAGLDATYEAVKQVTSMSNVPNGAGPPWGTENAFVVSLGVIFIILGKAVAVVAGIGGLMMAKNFRAPASAFSVSNRIAMLGAGWSFALMFFSFTIMAEGAFFMFYSAESGAGQLAFRFSASFALATFILSLRDFEEH